MPRSARLRSESGVYHVMVRGINREDIFIHPQDRIRYLEALSQVKEISGCSIYAYCLMRNHVHLLMAEGSEDTIGETMKRLGSSYVYWYNLKYERVGHLFQDRFLSEPVESDAYLLAALRYIHQNPVKAGIVQECGQYVWSSYLAYASGREQPLGLTNTGLALGIAGGLDGFLAFHREPSAYEFLDLDEKVRASDETICRAGERLLQGHPLRAILTLDAEERHRVVRELKAIEGASNRQIARLTGMNRKMVDRA